MVVITGGMRAAFRRDGFVVVSGALTRDQIAAGRAVVARMLDEQPFADGHVGPYFLWPRFGSAGHPLLNLYREAGVGGLAAQLLRSDLGVEDPDFAQVAATIPPWPRRPGGPHVDGMTPANQTAGPAPSRCSPACG